MAVVLIQSYEPLPELEGRDGVMPCDPALAQELVRQRRAEIVDPHAEAFRYCPGSRAYEAMRASRGQPGPVRIDDRLPAASLPTPPKRPKAARPRKAIA